MKIKILSHLLKYTEAHCVLFGKLDCLNLIHTKQSKGLLITFQRDNIRGITDCDEYTTYPPIVTGDMDTWIHNNSKGA